MAGRLDAVYNGAAHGWACDDVPLLPKLVRICVDGHEVCRSVASVFRQDLADAGIRAGNAGFQAILPEKYRDGKPHRVEAFEIPNGRPLDGSPFVAVVPALLEPYPFPTGLDFDADRPWLDADDDVFNRDLPLHANSTDSGRHLKELRNDGYTVLEGVVPSRLIDAALSDVERIWKEMPDVLVVSAAIPVPTLVSEVQQTPGFRASSFRYLDFHNVSEATAEIMCLPAIVEQVAAYLGGPVVSMQTLLFENGTEQRAHQDFPYLHPPRPAFLAGVWVALEDVHDDAGPLFYYRESHRRVPHFPFPQGSLFALGGDGPHVRQYEEFLAAQCQEAGLSRLEFKPRKGDALIWHAGLVHGGSPRRNPALTRKSLVSHYTLRDSYALDRRHPDRAPVVIERNNCTYHASQRPGHAENRFALP